MEKEDESTENLIRKFNKKEGESVREKECECREKRARMYEKGGEREKEVESLEKACENLRKKEHSVMIRD
jgi:hypothetical protein